MLTTMLALATAACGGGDGGLNSTPPPAPAPSTTPAPTPTPAAAVPPLPDGPIGLQSDRPFATFSVHTDGWGTIATDADAVEIAYSAADGTYTLTLPEYEEGVLLPSGGNGSFDELGWINLQSTGSDLAIGAGPETQLAYVTLAWPKSSPYTYTSYGDWSGQLPMGQNRGVFAYGTPTVEGDVPRIGSASYSGEVWGLTNGEPTLSGGEVGPVLDVYGTVSLTFDFAAGTLAGEMLPTIYPEWDPVSLGRYTFRDTVYSSGSMTFAGAFEVPDSDSPSSFLGRFTGPQAAELMANWRAPFRDPESGGWGTMSGVWIAKKDN